MVFFAIFYFMIIRPNSKRNKEHKVMVDDLVGHEVIFAGGLVGRIKKNRRRICHYQPKQSY